MTLKTGFLTKIEKWKKHWVLASQYKVNENNLNQKIDLQQNVI